MILFHLQQFHYLSFVTLHHWCSKEDTEKKKKDDSGTME